MSEQAYNPTAEELYAEYTKAYKALEEARAMPLADEGMHLIISGTDQLISTTNIEVDARQELLTELAELKSIEMDTRLRIQEVHTIAAEFVLETAILLSEGVYKIKKDEWHEEALEEKRARNEQSEG